MAQSQATIPPNLAKYLDRAYTLDGTEKANASLYDEWAESYDTDNAAIYASPRRAVEAVLKNIPATAPDTLKIFDAGCGTGLVGDSLAQSPLANKFVLDGVDLSPGMLEAARAKGIYRNLGTADLNAPIEKSDESYDLVMCVGTLTKAHVGPKVLAEFSRITDKSGLIVATVHNEIFESGGYRAEIERLQMDGTVHVVSTDDFGLVEWLKDGGKMVVLRKK